MEDMEALQTRISDFARELLAERGERQRRRSLSADDFDRLRELGFLRTGIPTSRGGLWSGAATSTRPICACLAQLAEADPSLALVVAMHPAVLVFWLAPPDAPAPYTEAWNAQRAAVFGSVAEGAFFGTLTSEPGSGGDVMRTRTQAKPDAEPGQYRLEGTKHFGSGSGMTSFMITMARPEGEGPDLFFLDMRDQRWDGSAGLERVAEWDGHGMRATQSHAFKLDGVRAERIAWPRAVAHALAQASSFGNCAFTAVAVGIVRVAVREARARLSAGSGELGAFETVEWVRIENESWLLEQAFEGMLRSVERERGAPTDTLRGKLVASELAESILGRIQRVVGGSSFSRSAPFGTWAQDVRALGFLRPPFPLAFEQLAGRVP